MNSDYEIRLATLGKMGGDMTKNYDSVYEIDLEILKLSGNAAQESDSLPDAAENKNKIVRLEGDEKLYAPVLVSKETTNKLPDNEQINKAYMLNAGDVKGYYKGAFKLICTDGEINCYGWGYEYIPEGESEEVTIIDTFTFDNAEDSNPDTILFYIDSGEWTFEGNVATTDIYTVSDMEENYYTISSDGGVVIPATYNAPEANQIGNAWIDFDSDVCYYTGVERETEIEGKDVTLYQWKTSGVTIYTSKKPHNMYYQNADDGEGNKSVMCDWITYNSDISEETSLQREVHIVPLNAPDSEQMDNATISVVVPMVISATGTYQGIETGITYQGQEIHGYIWLSNEGGGFYMTTSKAEDIYSKTDCDIYLYNTGGVVNKLTGDALDYLTLTTVPYSYTDENWEWKKISMDNSQEIYIEDTTSVYEWAKLDKFTETGIYDNIKLRVNYYNIPCPAKLIVQKIDETGNIMQYIKFYSCSDYLYGEYVWWRSYDNDNKEWNNAIDDNPKSLHTIN